jgi:hypothetical protein
MGNPKQVKEKKSGSMTLTGVDSEKDDAKMPAAGAGPSKDKLCTKYAVISPDKSIFSIPGRLSKQQIKRSIRAQGSYLHSVLVPGGIELIMISKESMTEDAYLNELIRAIEDKSDESIVKLDIVGKFTRRISANDARVLCNINSDYPRRVFVRILDPEETDEDSRLKALEVIQYFLLTRKSQWPRKYFIEKPGWDLTNYDDPLKLDNFLMFNDIVKLIKGMFNCGENWAAKNWKAADCFFTEGHIPFEAHKELGVPEEKVMACTSIVGNTTFDPN